MGTALDRDVVPGRGAFLAETATVVKALPTLLLRAETGQGVGIGHLARCLSLAATWVRRGGRAKLVTEHAPSPWPRRAADAGVVLVSVDLLEKAIEDAHAVVVDGYGLSSTARELGAGRCLMVIDDLGAADTSPADLVLDQNLGARSESDDAGDHLRGPRYALLPPGRRQVIPSPPAARRDAVKRLVVSLGGSVPPERRELALQALAAIGAESLEVILLDGTQDLAAVLPTADAALAAAGSTCWELCRFAVPTVLVTVAGNQVPVARALDAAGAMVDAGPLDDVASVSTALQALITDAERRVALAAASGRLVDGWGADRVVSRLRGMDLVLRPVTAADGDLLLAWRNDPATIVASFESRPVDGREHRRWLSGVLADPTRHHRIVLDRAGGTIGTVRFDALSDRRVEIGLTVAPDRRGEGWAAPVIDAAVRDLARERGPLEVLARVKTENRRSRHAFLAADFDPVRPGDGAGPDGAHEYIRLAGGR